MPEAGPHATAGGQGAAGCLLIIGGSERLDKHLRLLHTYVHLCDRVPGRRRLVIITTATGHPDLLGGEYIRIFGQLGWPAHEVHMPPLATRADAADPGVAALIAGAAGLFMTGGDQVTLVDVLRGTPAGDALIAAYRAGAVVAGTSAGATAIGDPMIARGGGTGELRQGMIALHPGLALAGNEIVVDTHFSQRGRFPRLVGALAERPSALGVGIDENTALLVPGGSRQAEILGAGVVYFIDSPGAHPPSVAAGGALSLAPLTLHILHEGQRYDLATRSLITPH